MSQVEADVDALKTFRHSLLTFAARQTEAMDLLRSAIAQTMAMLEEAAEYWRREIERRQGALSDCRFHAAMAAREGFALDCYPYEYALRVAEETLSLVLSFVERVREAEAAYQPVHLRIEEHLAIDFSRGTGFIDARITALEAYHATRLYVSAAALAMLGASTAMGGAIAAIRNVSGDLAQIMGAVGEQVAAQVLTERFGLTEVPFDQPKHGFDRVFRAPGIPLIVMESKVSGDGQLHLRQTVAGQQGSAEWIAGHAERMVERQSGQWSPANERIGRLVQEMGAASIPVVAVITDPVRGQADVYTQRGPAKWQLLRAAVPLDQVTESSALLGLPPEKKEGNLGGPERRG